MLDTISFTAMINAMDSVDGQGYPKPFSATIVTCDIERKKGGELLKVERAVIHTRLKKLKLLKSGEIRNFSPILITVFNGKQVIL